MMLTERFKSSLVTWRPAIGFAFSTTCSPPLRSSPSAGDLYSGELGEAKAKTPASVARINNNRMSWGRREDIGAGSLA